MFKERTNILSLAVTNENEPYTSNNNTHTGGRITRETYTVKDGSVLTTGSMLSRKVVLSQPVRGTLPILVEGSYKLILHKRRKTSHISDKEGWILTT